MADNPCRSSLAATVVTPNGRGRVVTASPATSPKIDCFYVYPTVSAQPTANANLTVDPEETAVAVAQASRFSQVCNVYAPMYRQLTRAAIAGRTPVTQADDVVAYTDVLNAWKYYLAHDNHGRGVAVIGHSQGAAMLMSLLRTEVDPVPAERALLVSAILLGGNVTVPVGKLEGGTFAHIPLCANVNEPGCIIAYSSYPTTPPADSTFGRVTSPIRALNAHPPISQQQVACVNPVAGTTYTPAPSSPAVPAGTPANSPTTTSTPTASAASARSTGPLVPYFPTGVGPDRSPASVKQGRTTVGVSTPWVTYPRLYQASCERAGGASWLEVTPTTRRGDNRPLVQESLGPAWGFHLVDVNIALGNLVTDLQHQAQHFGH
jgi:hypothetical protein